MSIDAKERNLEEDVEEFLTSSEDGYLKASDKQSFLYIEDGTYQVWDGHGCSDLPGRGIDIKTLVNFVQVTQPKSWARFEKQCSSDAEKKFAKVFQDAVDMDGIVGVLKHGFKHRGIPFKVVHFKPESILNDTAGDRYAKNVCRCIRQFHYVESGNQTIDMMLDVNGIPVVGMELKNRLTSQDVEDAVRQWREDRDPREVALRFNSRMVALFAVAEAM